MKPTIKVSIGGFAFNLENDAYQMIEDYLKKLNKHFEHNPEGKEIITDVESRMAELLQMRMDDKNGVVSAADASDIISIMGNPKDFDGEQVESPAKEDEKKFNAKKRLYRDTDNKVLSGVCGGLGCYFNIDPVIVRMLFVVLLIVSWWLSGVFFNTNIEIFNLKFGSILLYIILWIAMPKAKTLEQKIAMTGKDPGIENIEDRTQAPLQQKRGSGVCKIITVFFGIVIGLNLFGILLSLIAIMALFFGFSFNSNYPSLTTMLDIFSLNYWDVKLSALMTVVLPLLGVGYICYKLLFWKRFTVRDAVISLIAFILWLGACCYAGGVALNMVNKHERKATATEITNLGTASDILYVKMADEYADANPVFDEDSHLLYLKEDGNSSVIYAPHIYVQKDSGLSTFEVVIEKTAFDETRKAAQYKVDNFRHGCMINDSLLIINPQVFDKKHPWNREYYTITIRVPANKKVIFKEPFVKNYTGDEEYSEKWNMTFKIG
jgi:phage shock protein PspC (stress-responsive transcriptional regulator)/tetrahydromethanopterin S-methyltransferase subunit G